MYPYTSCESCPQFDLNPPTLWQLKMQRGRSVQRQLRRASDVKDLFVCGAPVWCNYRGRGRFFEGHVTAENTLLGTRAVRYDGDGGTESDVDGEFYSFRANPAHILTRSPHMLLDPISHPLLDAVARIMARTVKGTLVDGRFGARERWFPATVSAARLVDGDEVLDLAYDDGDVEFSVPWELVRLRGSASAAGGDSDGGDSVSGGADLVLGARCEARFGGGPRWFPARVRFVHADGSYDWSPLPLLHFVRILPHHLTCSPQHLHGHDVISHHHAWQVRTTLTTTTVTRSSACGAVVSVLRRAVPRPRARRRRRLLASCLPSTGERELELLWPLRSATASMETSERAAIGFAGESLPWPTTWARAAVHRFILSPTQMATLRSALPQCACASQFCLIRSSMPGGQRCWDTCRSNVGQMSPATRRDLQHPCGCTSLEDLSDRGAYANIRIGVPSIYEARLPTAGRIPTCSG